MWVVVGAGVVIYFCCTSTTGVLDRGGCFFAGSVFFPVVRLYFVALPALLLSYLVALLQCFDSDVVFVVQVENCFLLSS